MNKQYYTESFSKKSKQSKGREQEESGGRKKMDHVRVARLNKQRSRQSLEF